MTRITALLVAWLLALGLQGTPAQAQTARTFISANGLDANDCARPRPCRTLQVAYDKTNIGGEINMLDPAGYGPVIITHSISIVNDGVGSAGILVPAGGPTSGVGIVINAGPEDEINLRGLVIEGIGVGFTGIQFNTGKSLTIQNCVVRNMNVYGLDFRPTGSSKLSISDCFVMHNAQHGIIIRPQGSGSAFATFNRVESSYNSEGFYLFGGSVSGPIDATATNCVAAGNDFAGFHTDNDGSPVRLTVVDSVSAYNGAGIHISDLDSRARVGGTTVTGNGVGWQATGGGIIETYGDNFVHGNAVGEGTMTPISPK
ncbi:MAG: hypothetical protein QOI12_2024 [Alphaproteobacteria bacterium]|jgi:hypothetical protein|nr:hypothetical protein [Alphaproteobacteria bacterium]